ncbi:MAG TPA: histidine phosphatase family protein [Planctomycetota bacterium]|nr:histidine phosphatase family protein [Planctomycetota bacterium]
MNLSADKHAHPGPHPGFKSGAWVWLLRHGEVHADWHGKAYGGLDVPLSEQGERDTQAAIEAFSSIAIERVVSSNLARARRLGEGIAAATGAPLTVSAGLAEIQRGTWQGLSIADLSRERPEQLAGFYADPWNYDVHGGETDRDVLERAWPELERGIASGAKLVALTCHYNVVRVLLTRMLGMQPSLSFRLRIDLSGACLLHDGPEGWRLVRANVKGPRPWPPGI